MEFSFPAGYLARVDTRGNEVGPGWGWAAQLLPQIEQVSLYEKLNFELPIEALANSKLRLIRQSVAAMARSKFEERTRKAKSETSIWRRMAKLSRSSEPSSLTWFAEQGCSRLSYYPHVDIRELASSVLHKLDDQVWTLDPAD